MSNATLVIDNPSAYLMDSYYIENYNSRYFISSKTGFSEAAKALNSAFTYAIDHYFQPVTRSTKKQKFQNLALTWKIDTRHESSARNISLNPAYQQIIGMGTDAIPFILKDMKKEPGHWFMALQAITGINPIQPANRGNVQAMTEDWLSWGNESGFNC